MKVIIFALGGLLIGGLLQGVAQSARADEKKCQHETCWGAVGIGPGTAHGYSYWYKDEEAAINRVVQSCPSCAVIRTFANTCGALAQAGNASWGFATGASKDEVRENAVAACKAEGGGDCSVRVWGCSRK